MANNNQRQLQKSGEIDKTKKRRFENMIREFENDIQEVHSGSKNALDVAEKMEATLKNIDETITTLQSDKDSVKQKLKNKKETLGKSNIKNINDEQFHPLQLHELTKQLNEINAKINDWRAYQVEISDLRDEMLEQAYDQTHEDQLNVEAAKRYTEVVDDKLDNIRDVLEQVMDEKYNSVESRVDSKFSEKNAELESRITSNEKDIEYMQKNIDTLLRSLVENLDDIAEAAKNENNVGSVEEVKEDAQKLQSGMDEKERAKQLNSDTDIEENQTIEDSSSSDEGEIDGISEEVNDIDASYEMEMKAASELVEIFEQIEDDFEEPSKVTAQTIADHSDISQEKVKQKLEYVRKEKDEDFLPHIET